MNLRLFIRLATISSFLNFLSHAATNDPAADWPAWRGPTRDGIASPSQNPPLHWSESENVLWKTPIPGRGHSSPTVVSERIYLATSDPDKKSQSIFCLDRNTGKLLWQSEAHATGADSGHQANSSAASSSVSCDGERLYISFLNNGAVYTTAFDLNGKKLWQQKICDYVTHQGFASSPVLHENLVLVSADHRGGGTLAGLDRKTGNIVWTVARPKIANYTTPAILQAAGKAQMVIAGCNLVTSLDPITGKKLWEIEGSTEECVTTAVTDGRRVFISGGYPKNHTAAIEADGSGKIAWQNTARVYVPSMIVKEGHLYAILDAGMAVCWKSDTGEELWKERLGGDFFASPVMVGDRIYASNLRATTFVFEAKPSGFKLLAQNQLADEQYASPTICGSRVYIRSAKRADQRQEFLYCVANAAGETR
jgi:outer membrane protein assembly factor BamB